MKKPFLHTVSLMMAAMLLLGTLLLSGCSNNFSAEESGSTSESSLTSGTDVVFVDPSQVRPDYGKLGFESNGFTFGIYDTMDDIIAGIGDPNGTFEAASCAYQGNDYFYYYSGFELMANDFDGVQRLTHITVIDDTVSTPQGITIGMAAIDFTASSISFTDEGNGKFTHQEGSCIMQVIIKNDKVSAIEYYPAK